MTNVTRRVLLAGSGLGAAAAALPRSVRPPWRPRLNGQQAPGVYRYKIGSYELTALHDGTWYRPIDEKFVKNAAWPDVQKALADIFFPPTSCRFRSPSCS